MSDPQVKAFHQTRLQFQLTEYTHRPIHGLERRSRLVPPTVQASLMWRWKHSVLQLSLEMASIFRDTCS